MESFGIIIIIVFAFVLYFARMNSHDKRIREEVNSLGGSVISIERRTFKTGPFILPGKGKMVYRVEYSVGDTVKEGWVKFGGMFGPDWRL